MHVRARNDMYLIKNDMFGVYRGMYVGSLKCAGRGRRRKGNVRKRLKGKKKKIFLHVCSMRDGHEVSHSDPVGRWKTYASTITVRVHSMKIGII